jgi:chromosomal replication initiation ATPase DnaA
MTPREKSLSDVGLIALKHGLQREDLLGRQRFPRISRARQEAFYHFRRKGWSYTEIGRLFDRDHSTIIHGVEKHQKVAFALPVNAGTTEGLI